VAGFNRLLEKGLAAWEIFGQGQWMMLLNYML
jgi:hypothetical protein